MTSSGPDDPARRLYRSTGWAVIGPGLTDRQVIIKFEGKGLDKDHVINEYLWQKRN